MRIIDWCSDVCSSDLRKIIVKLLEHGSHKSCALLPILLPMLQHLRLNEKDHLLSNVSDMIPHPLQLSDDRKQIQRMSNVVRIIANVIRNDPSSLAISSEERRVGKEGVSRCRFR